MQFTPHERARLQARSHCSPETIERYPNVREATRLRIQEAARLEGITLPGSAAHLDGPDPRDE